MRRPNDPLRQIAEASVEQLLQRYVNSGVVAYIVDAVAECGRLGIAPTPALLRALPIVKATLPRQRAQPPSYQSLKIVHKIAAIHAARQSAYSRRDSPDAKPRGPEATSNEALRRIAEELTAENRARNKAARKEAKEQGRRPAPDLPDVQLQTIKQVLHRWRKVYGTGVPSRAKQLK